MSAIFSQSPVKVPFTPFQGTTTIDLVSSHQKKIFLIFIYVYVCLYVRVYATNVCRVSMEARRGHRISQGLSYQQL